MAYDAKAIANYFLSLAEVDGVTLTPMKIQKLVYYAHGWHLALADAPLIKEEVQAWEYGPVVSSVYAAFREYGNDAITSPAKEVKVEENAYKWTIPEIPIGPAHNNARDIMKKVWEIYKPLSAIQLSNMTHAPGSPWTTVRQPYGSNVPYGLAIPNEVIKEYFLAGISKEKS